MINRHRAVVAFSLAFLLVSPAFGQDDGDDGGGDELLDPGCQAVPLPTPAILRDLGCPRYAADCRVAVGTQRMVVTSNCGVSVRCKNGAARDTVTPVVPLGGASLVTAMFGPTPNNDPNHPFTSISHYDPRVIWDGHSNRFWVVASEQGQHPVSSENRGRIHVAVSKTASPNGHGTTFWHKYSGGAGAAGPAFNPHAAPGDPIVNAIADRPSIAVDETFLYIAFRETNPGIFQKDRNWWANNTVVLIIPNASMLNGQATAIETAKRIEIADPHRTRGHELALDYDIQNDGVNKVYMVTLPTLYYLDDTDGNANVGRYYSTLRFGALRKSGGNWVYDGTNISLTGGDDFLGVSPSAPGAPGGLAVDGNALVKSLFWQCVTRRVGGVRKVWATHDIRENPITDFTDVSSKIQWYEINPNNWPSNAPTLARVERLNVTPDWLHDPSIAVNASGDVALTFTRSGDDQYPEMWRWLFKADGTDQRIDKVLATVPNLYFTGGGNPWADYSGTDVDPSDPCVFWGHTLLVFDDGVAPSSQQFQTWLDKFVTPWGGCGG